MSRHELWKIVNHRGSTKHRALTHDDVGPRDWNESLHVWSPGPFVGIPFDPASPSGSKTRYHSHDWARRHDVLHAIECEQVSNDWSGKGESIGRPTMKSTSLRWRPHFASELRARSILCASKSTPTIRRGRFAFARTRLRAPSHSRNQARPCRSQMNPKMPPNWSRATIFANLHRRLVDRALRGRAHQFATELKACVCAKIHAHSPGSPTSIGYVDCTCLYSTADASAVNRTGANLALLALCLGRRGRWRAALRRAGGAFY